MRGASGASRGASDGGDAVTETLDALLARVRACRICEDVLVPRPVLRLHREARILLVGQAPGAKVHASGRPWADASGDHLLEWLGVDRATFDDPRAFGILPAGFCYPGKGRSADRPPDPRCAATWHPPLRERLGGVRLTLAVGLHAHALVLGDRRRRTLTETVRAHRAFAPALVPLPHPSWRSRGWRTRNPWFDAEVLPALRKAVRAALA